MTPVLWIIGFIVVAFIVLVVIGLCGQASDPYDEEECEETVERSNGLSEENKDDDCR